MELQRREESIEHRIDRRTVLAGALGVGMLLLTGCDNGGTRRGGRKPLPSRDGGPDQAAVVPSEAEVELWTPEQPEIIVDSAMTLEEALAGKDMPEAVRRAQC